MCEGREDLLHTAVKGLMEVITNEGDIFDLKRIARNALQNVGAGVIDEIKKAENQKFNLN